MTVDELLNYHYETLSENEKYICHYLSRHREECRGQTAAELAAELGVSKTLLVRFAKKLGLSGYSELKAQLTIELKEREAGTAGLLETMTDSYHKMLDDLLKKDLSVFFHKLYWAHRVFVYGSGASQARAASEMARVFLPVKQMIHLHGHDLLASLRQIAKPEDLVILISLSGESEGVVELARSLRTNHVPAVSVTRQRNNTLASLCGINLYINSIRLPVGYRLEYETTTPYFILIEYLYLSYQSYLTGPLASSTAPAAEEGREKAR